MFQGMRIYSNNANRCCPFMVDLVDKPVNTRMMEQPEEQRKDKFLFVQHAMIMYFQSSPSCIHDTGYYENH